MKKCKLGDLLEIQHGYAFKSENYLHQGKFALVTLANISESNNFQFNEDNLTYYESDFPKNMILNEGDLIMPMTEQVIGLLGNSAFIPVVKNFSFVLNQRVGKVIPKSCVDKYYLHYLLATNEVKTQLEYRASGTKQRNISPDNIYDVTVYVPELHLQEKIGSVLYSIEKKINLNKKINATLEAMAKTLYDYWFVQFDFPDENGKPYKTSGGKMIYNAELGREIPAGWEVKRLSDFAIYATEKISSENISINQYIATDNMLSNMQGIIISQYEPLELKIQEFKCGDILLANIRPYFKKIWLSYFDGGCNSDVLVIRSKNIKNAEYVYSTLARDDFFSYNVAGSKGTKMPRGDKTHIMHYSILSNEILTKLFVDKVRPIYRKIYESTVENNCLAALRDWLLPMLMNGQVVLRGK